MANYATLKAAIADVVKQNGNNEITGNLLQQALLAMVNSLGANYQFAGIATLTTNPGTPDQNVFYLASVSGTYPNFDGIVVDTGETAILKYNGTWTKETTGLATKEYVDASSEKISIFENPGNANIDKLKAFVKSLKIYNAPKDLPRLRVHQIWKNYQSDGRYRIFITQVGQTDYYFYINLSSAETNIRFTNADGVSLEMFVDWSELSNGITSFQSPEDNQHNVISLNCYIDVPGLSDVDLQALQQDVQDLQAKVNGQTLVSYSNTQISDFVIGYYLPESATEFSENALVSNANCCYKRFEIPQNQNGRVFVKSGYGNNYDVENVFFLDSNNQVISVHSFTVAGVDLVIPQNAVYICACFLKNYTPFGISVYEPPTIVDEILPVISDPIKAEVETEILGELDNYLTITRSHQERTLRDTLFERERRNPFAWKAFEKRWFAFMNDDANQDMTQYYAVCRDRRVPYCHAFILNRASTYPYSGNDANRTNLVKNPAVGQSYTVSKLATQTYLRLYFDRQYTLGFPVNITVNGTAYVINSPDNARISVGSGTSVTFTITSIGALTAGRTNFINVIATADATDSATSSATWAVADVVKNIVFDFGEILAHDGPVINMWDLKEAENLFAKYIFDDPRKINNLLGEEHCRGAILPGGPNSNRGMNTDLGQHYCCRYLLYADYYGTTPQYMIERVSYSAIVGQTTVDYATAKANALAWLANRANGFYPLFTHSEKTPQEVAGVIDAILESNDTICSNWFNAYEQNS